MIDPRLAGAWVEIDLGALRHNFREVRKLSRARMDPVLNRDIGVLSVVKADGYGHGMLNAVKVIAGEGGSFFAVSNISEALVLRSHAPRSRILLFEAVFPEIAADIVKYDLVPALCTVDMARALDRAALRAGKLFPVHIKVDTGMSRMGVPYRDLAAFVEQCLELDHIYIEGLFTHFPVADSDPAFTRRQVDLFSELAAGLTRQGVAFRYLHAANSMGLAAYKNRYFNLTRPGVMLYGLYPDARLRGKVDLRPVMTVKTRVLLVKRIPARHGISYGHTARTVRAKPAAVLAIGYSDGYFRSLSGKGKVLLNGRLCPVLGRVTMDQIIVDISRAGRVRVGDTAVILGRQGRAVVSAEDIAAWAGTINYEVTCSLGSRLPRSE
jgi:alanine racemase